MKSKKYKRKFRDLGDIQWNNISSSQNFETYPSKIKSGKEYQTPLESLVSLYPSLSSDTIEDIYIENNRNYFKTKEVLESLCQAESPREKFENFVDINEYKYEENENKNNNNNNEKIDLTKFAKFQIDSDIDINNNVNSSKNDNFEVDNDLMNDNNSSKNEDKKKKPLEYKSVFEVNEKIITPIPGGDGEVIIDDFLLDDYVTLLCNIFPQYTRKEIMGKICEMDFDIDKVVLSFFDECSPSQEEYEKLENFEFTNKEEILSNFSSYDAYNNNKIDIDAIEAHNLQKEIEEDIKKHAKNNYEIAYGDFKKSLSDEKEEYFLDKKINEIQTPEIRNNLTILSKQFPFEDEFTLKWVYYQYMDYNQSYNYLQSKNKKVSYGLKSLVDSIDKSKSKGGQSDSRIKSKNDIKQYNSNRYNNSNSYNNSLQNKIISSIIGDNPSKWEFKNQDNINLTEYQNIRRQLIIQAQIAFSAKRYQEAKAIMAKARRYKQEINSLMERKKVTTYLKNNQHLSVENLVSDDQHTVDLHGLSLEESKMVITKKCRDLLDKKEREGLNKITLCLITGIGTHSKNNVPVLLPGIIAWIKGKTRYRFKVDESHGIIRVVL